jgi:hypothetical protein
METPRTKRGTWTNQHCELQTPTMPCIFTALKVSKFINCRPYGRRVFNTPAQSQEWKIRNDLQRRGSFIRRFDTQPGEVQVYIINPKANHARKAAEAKEGFKPNRAPIFCNIAKRQEHILPGFIVAPPQCPLRTESSSRREHPKYSSHLKLSPETKL